MPVTLHEGTTFIVSDTDGDIHPGTDHGLYFQDSRYMSRCLLRLDGEAPLVLAARASSANQGLFVLTNPALPRVEHKQLGILRFRLLDDGLHDDLRIENYGEDPARFELSLDCGVDFVHIFDVKQVVESGEKTHHREHLANRDHVEHDGLTWLRIRRDGLPAETAVGFSLRPRSVQNGVATFEVTIPPRGRWELFICVQPRTQQDEPLPRDVCMPPAHPRRDSDRNRRQRELESLGPDLQCDHEQLARAYRQAARDMVSLRLKAEDSPHAGSALAAGIPWYMALFGRDSLIASYQTLMHDPSLARGTLRALAERQGTRVDVTVAEEPGKILHEDRHGPLVGDPKYIPKFPYYGTIDATPLFLITLAEYVRVTGDQSLATELASNVERALDWMDQYGDRDGDGLLEYIREGSEGLSNQGWKDSWDSVRFRDGHIASPPIALVEVQGYAYRAFAAWSDLYRRRGKSEESDRLAERARRIREAIARSFWLEDRGYFAEALDGNKHPVDALTSNPGHLLWSHAISPDHARAVGQVLLSDAMFSGYGIRTMAKGEGGYNPISYHNGSVWPHDNSLIVEGLARMGMRDEAARVVQGLLESMTHYTDNRLPELFAGYSSANFGTPVEYPSANRPQAWASGAVILMTRVALGLDINALDRQIALRPLAIQGLTRATLRRVPAGESRIDIEYACDGSNVDVRVRALPQGWTLVA